MNLKEKLKDVLTNLNKICAKISDALKKVWNKIKTKIVLLCPLILAMIIISLQSVTTISQILNMIGLIIIFESLIYYLLIGFSKWYNAEVNFEHDPAFNRIVASLIIGIHVMVGVVVLGVFFAV